MENSLQQKPLLPTLVALISLCRALIEYIEKTGTMEYADIESVTKLFSLLSRQNLSGHSKEELLPLFETIFDLMGYFTPKWPIQFYGFAVNMLGGPGKMHRHEIDQLIEDHLKKNTDPEEGWKLLFFSDGSALIANKKWQEAYHNQSVVEDPDEAGFPYRFLVGGDGFPELVKTTHSGRVN